MHTLSRRRLLGVGLTSVALTALPGLARSAAATSDPALVGSWSEPFDLGVVAIHAALLHTEELLLFSYVEGDPDVDHTSLVKTYDIEDGTTAVAPIGYHRDLFCAGMNALPDGRIFVSGGHDHHTGKKIDFRGWNATDLYDPITRGWTSGPSLAQKRWYPTALSMPAGNTLIFGGAETRSLPSPTVESYDPVTNTMRTLPSTATKNIGLYPRMHLLPRGVLIKTGPAQRSLSFDPATNRWINGPYMRYGNRTLGCSVLLPGSTQVLAFGGKNASTGLATGTAELLDTTAPTPAWTFTGSMSHPRIHANGVVLPDGTVLAIGGGTSGTFEGPVKTAELYSPATGRWSSMAPQSAQRTYHSTAVLLPDGRVLSAGSNSSSMETFAEIYSPPYLHRGPQPVITGAPSSVAYGAGFTVTTDVPVTSLVLMRPGAVTHQVDTEQRSVPLTTGQPRTGDDGTPTYPVTGPAHAGDAPAGYYMLFALTAEGVPSVARFVRVG